MALLKTYSISTDITEGEVNPELLHTEIDAGGDITNFTGLQTHGDNLDVHGDSFISETNVDTIVEDHIACPLADYKQIRYDEINAKTKELIEAGFTYDSETFNATPKAQFYWEFIHVNQTSLTFPFAISTKDYNEYEIEDEDSADLFHAAGLIHVKGYEDSGRVLNKSIYDAANKTAVDAIVDTR